jgi:hypothetical protein
MTKISDLISKWKKGMILTSPFLKNEGIRSDLVKRYLSSKWLRKVGNEAYKLYDDEIDIFGATQALQDQLGKSIRIGGKSALSYLGYSHYLSQKSETVFLYGNYKEKLPVWFINYEWNEKYKYYSPNLFDIELNDYLTGFSRNGISAMISCAELALFEMLYLIPSEQSFPEAFLIAENLRTLRADKIQILLEKCNSVKVKRMVLFILEENDHAYFKSIDVSKVELGSGKRMIVKDGKYNSKYKITVPRNLHD